jgi:hypothetical protein
LLLCFCLSCSWERQPLAAPPWWPISAICQSIAKNGLTRRRLDGVLRRASSSPGQRRCRLLPTWVFNQMIPRSLLRGSSFEGPSRRTGYLRRIWPSRLCAGGCPFVDLRIRPRRGVDGMAPWRLADCRCCHYCQCDLRIRQGDIKDLHGRDSL